MENRKFVAGAWFAFGMALALIVNGVTTFTGPGWLWDVSRILIVVFGFGVLPAIRRRIMEGRSWVTWATNLAYLGLGAEALRQLGGLEIETVLLLFGGLAIWGLTLNVLAIQHKLWPNALAGIGISSSLLLFGALVASQVPAFLWLDTVSAGLGAVVLYPIWLIWTGLRLQNNKHGSLKEMTP
jgi:hypothetical protein